MIRLNYLEKISIPESRYRYYNYRQCYKVILTIIHYMSKLIVSIGPIKQRRERKYDFIKQLVLTI